MEHNVQRHVLGELGGVRKFEPLIDARAVVARGDLSLDERRVIAVAVPVPLDLGGQGLLRDAEVLGRRLQELKPRGCLGRRFIKVSPDLALWLVETPRQGVRDDIAHPARGTQVEIAVDLLRSWGSLRRVMAHRGERREAKEGQAEEGDAA